jgi:hypothetical protein
MKDVRELINNEYFVAEVMEETGILQCKFDLYIFLLYHSLFYL